MKRNPLHLPYPVHSSARSVETLVQHLLLPPGDPPLAARWGGWTVLQSNRRCHFHPGKARGNPGPRHPRSLGGDLLGGTKNSYIATLVERYSRFTALVKVPSKDTAVVVAALSRHIRKLPASLRRSLTWDRGLEMVQHKSFTVTTDVKVYFCDPQGPWQRSTNEITNRLLRQHFRKRTDLSRYT